MVGVRALKVVKDEVKRNTDSLLGNTESLFIHTASGKLEALSTHHAPNLIFSKWNTNLVKFGDFSSDTQKATDDKSSI